MPERELLALETPAPWKNRRPICGDQGRDRRTRTEANSATASENIAREVLGKLKKQPNRARQD